MRPGWYHVSTHDHGLYHTFEPRIPRGPAIGEDRATPRISVAEDIDRCLLGITGLKCPPIGYVYRLHGRAKGFDFDTPMRKVPDWEETNEAWLLEPNPFRLVMVIAIEFNLLEDDFPRWTRIPQPKRDDE